ncbi:recombinase XerD [Gordoniibacillus kamchatkensis]|uniref:Tyrosine recombinase XerC n=2 Tax=Gordoniibacillus kamchatkensis TaxID=1590651 RepID=A0ABR5A7P2_9BACL|nr:recombinase XerD [Paenibacillus sp. VKM B-2647]
MEQDVETMLAEMAAERRLADNTLASYRRDLLPYISYLREQGVLTLAQSTKTNVSAYLSSLSRRGRSPATRARAVVSIRALYAFLVRSGRMGHDPARFIEAPKAPRKTPRALPVADVERLLAAPDTNTPSGQRDKAMLELLYATGLRVTELVSLHMSDVNVALAFLRCEGGDGQERIVPIGGYALQAIEAYLREGRPRLLRPGVETDALFVSQRGDGMTRQAFWNIVKRCAEAAGITASLTPQLLRSSFAAHLLANGADVRAVQDMLGHASAASTQAYAQTAKALMKDVYDAAHPRSGKRM